MTPAAERKRQERERYREQGLRPLTLWVKPEHREPIKAYAAVLAEYEKDEDA